MKKLIIGIIIGIVIGLGSLQVHHLLKTKRVSLSGLDGQVTYRSTKTDSDWRNYNVRYVIEPAVVARIKHLAGVETAYMDLNRKYEIIIAKGSAFTWDEVHPKIMEVLK